MTERQPQPVAGPSSMADDPGTSFSDVDEEDPQLKIRIPNPRVYLEKQYSQWQSQRGRVRCDYCRGQKLKVRLSPGNFGECRAAHGMGGSAIACCPGVTTARSGQAGIAHTRKPTRRIEGRHGMRHIRCARILSLIAWDGRCNRCREQNLRGVRVCYACRPLVLTASPAV
jgi:hypothetical protein